MKSLTTLLLLSVSVFFAGRQAHNNTDDTTSMATGKDFFRCTVDGRQWSSASPGDSATAGNAGLSVALLHGNTHCMQPCGLLVNAIKKEDKSESYFYIQPLSEGATAPLPVHTNIYNSIYITYKTAEGKFYSTAALPGSFEITEIDPAHQYIAGRFNCILYSSIQDDYLFVTNGKFSFHLSDAN